MNSYIPEIVSGCAECRLQEFNQRATEEQLGIAPIDYAALLKTFAELGVNGLNNGLSIEENLVLFNTINTEEAIGLILMGLARCKIKSVV
jgi:hypothetical protein